MTSKRLMKNLGEVGVFHIDGTYKLMKNGFPTVVFGITDLSRRFHPICFYITSHEETSDFENFYMGLKDLAFLLKIDFNPEFILQDASSSSYNEAKKIYPTVTILMCYFHVMKNMKSYQIHLPIDKRDDMIEHVTIIHKSMDKREFESEIDKFKIKYEDYNEFYDLASKWFTGRFNQWQVFRIPAGSTNTAGCEPFNAVIKREYNLHKKMSVAKLMDTFGDLTIYYSANSLKFDYLPKYEH